MAVSAATGAPLAMAEMRTVVTEILRRVDLETTDRPAERPQHRNVTMRSPPTEAGAGTLGQLNPPWDWW